MSDPEATPVPRSASFEREVAALVEQYTRDGFAALPGGRFVLRCGAPMASGRCLRPRRHDGDCSPRWGTQ